MGIPFDEYRFVRVPVKKGPKFVEYPITCRGGKYYECSVTHVNDICSLFELPSIVGFAGVKFEGIEKDGFRTILSAVIYNPDLNEDIPATPIAARFWIEGEK
jgi:hypothetical protein